MLPNHNYFKTDTYVVLFGSSPTAVKLGVAAVTLVLQGHPLGSLPFATHARWVSISIIFIRL